MEQAQMGPRRTDPAVVFEHLTRWAAKFHDDLSPAAVTDVLVVFALIVGLNMAVADPAFAVALVSRIKEQMPSAAEDARMLAVSLECPLPIGSHP